MFEKWKPMLACFALVAGASAYAGPSGLSTGLATDVHVATLFQMDLPTQYADAQCNDGSPYSIYYRPGRGAGRQRLVIWFQGGGSCMDDDSCVDRWHPKSPLMSSIGWNPTRVHNEGLLSVEDTVSPLAGDAVVFLPYCSSDAFVGTREPFPVAGLPFELRFKGAAITEAVTDLLQTAPPPGVPSLRSATRVVVVGNSAGTGGVFGHADRLAALTSSSTDVYAVANAAWLFDYPSLNRQVIGLGGILGYLDLSTDYWEAKLDDDCMAQFGRGGGYGHLGACLLGESGSDFVDTPLFVAMSQQDPALMNLLAPEPVSAMTQAFRDVLSGASVEGVFSLNNSDHGSLHATDRFLDDSSGVSPKEVFEAFLAQPGDNAAFHIDP